MNNSNYISIFFIALFRLSVFKSEVSKYFTDVALPDRLIVGYANWNECDQKIIRAVKAGVNVLIWFAINLSTNETDGKPIITGGPDMECVASKTKEIRELGLHTVHLISIGGWDVILNKQ